MTTHGGKRTGAGRKPIRQRDRRVSMTISMSRKNAEFLKAQRDRGMVISKIIDSAIELWVDKNTHY